MGRVKGNKKGPGSASALCLKVKTSDRSCDVEWREVARPNGLAGRELRE